MGSVLPPNPGPLLPILVLFRLQHTLDLFPARIGQCAQPGIAHRFG